MSSPQVPLTPTTISAPPNTDIWRKPPTTDVFSAPHKLSAPFPLRSFSRAQVTFAAKWTHRYDQGGLLLRFTSKRTSTGSVDAKMEQQPQWVKIGVEFYQDKPFLSTVACDRWADWSILPLGEAEGGGGGKITVEARREGDELGRSLWVYLVVKDGNGEVVERKPVREIAWAFEKVDENGEEVLIEVGYYAARPAGEAVAGKDLLDVSFWDLDVEKV